MADHKFLIFKLDEQNFGMDTTLVDQIIPLSEITKIPNVPDYIEGVTSLRDEVYTVFNLRRRFNLPAREADENTRIIVTNINSELVGFIADEVNEIVNVDEEKLESAPQDINNPDKKYIDGVADIGGKRLYIINLNQIISLS